MAVVTAPKSAQALVMQLPPRVLLLRFRRILAWGSGMLLTFALCLALVYADVCLHSRPLLYNLQTAPARPVAIVFGAGYTRNGLSTILYDRVYTAAQLYKAGKARKLLLTGDNATISHNEPEAMRQAALKMGVPKRDIVLDYAGFRTYDSLYRARDIFGVRKAILITQAYHLPRALYTARALGLDVVGVAADRRDYGQAMPRYKAREILASENAWMEVHITHPVPARMGKKEPILGTDF